MMATPSTRTFLAAALAILALAAVVPAPAAALPDHEACAFMETCAPQRACVALDGTGYCQVFHECTLRVGGPVEVCVGACQGVGEYATCEEGRVGSAEGCESEVRHRLAVACLPHAVETCGTVADCLGEVPAAPCGTARECVAPYYTDDPAMPCDVLVTDGWLALVCVDVHAESCGFRVETWFERACFD